MIRAHSLLVASALSLAAVMPAAWANPPERTASAPAPAAASPTASPAAPIAAQTNAEQRVEAHVKQLHAQLQITPAEEQQWRQFADVMRANARTMGDLFAARAEQYGTMNALQDMQSYEQLATTHAEHLQKLVPAFASLYNAMPPEQQRLTDQVFRANAEARAHRKMQTGSNNR